MKRKIPVILITVLIIIALLPAAQASAEAGISIGDYISMGTYYGVPVLWRCVDIDENGPLILSDKIIALKPFDARGNNESGSHGRGYYDTKRQCYMRHSGGSNYWADSNIRCWLNSEEAAGNVNWTCGNAPDREHVSYNAYDNEAGFLTNFSESELSAVKQVTQKSILDGFEYSGTSNEVDSYFHRGDKEIEFVLQNYDTALSEQVTDYMFLTDLKQIKKIYENSDILGSDYYLGELTPQCVLHSEYKDDLSLEAGFKCDSWLRTPFACSCYGHGRSYYVRTVGTDGYINYDYAYYGNIGVRPAFYLDIEAVSFNGGEGTEDAPYYIEERSYETAEINIGDYVTMGKYNGAPVLWRCVDIDDNGPLMLSDKILALKPFDAYGKNIKGSHGRGYNNNGIPGYYRQNCGSNYWADSNIRCWLNSLSPAGKVKWNCANPPDSGHVWYNSYDQEAGFLSGYSTDEIIAMKRVEQRSLIDGYEYTDSSNTPRSSYHRYSTEIDDVLKNYEWAFSKMVTDIIFLPDVLQINAVYNNRSILGDGYYIGEPTAECVANSEYKSDDFKTGNKWASCLRSPGAGLSYSIFVRRVAPDGSIGSCTACDGRIGVRPAFYLNLSTCAFKGGTGAESDPLFIEGETKREEKVTVCSFDGSVVSVEAETTAAKTGNLIILAAYDKAGNLIDTKIAETVENINNYVFSNAFENTDKEYNYKLFVWDKKTMNPLGKADMANDSGS